MTAFTPTSATFNVDELHWPGRIDCLESLEDHVTHAARLSRALWNAIEPAGFKDERDRWALHELTGEIADHASAAYYLMLRGEDRAEAAKTAAPAPVAAPAAEPINETTPPIDLAYELAMLQKQRNTALAALLDAAFEAGTRFEPDEAEGIACLAKDIAKGAAECAEAVRLAALERWQK